MSRKDLKRQSKERKKAAKAKRTSKKVQSVEIDWSMPSDPESPTDEFAWLEEAEESTGQRVPF
jgi:hypothetical protein